MRLFVGIDLPENIKEEVYAITKKINTKNAKINFVAKKNLHLTLKFLINIDPKALEELVKRLETIKESPFKISLDSLSFFKRNGDISSIYLTLEPKDRLVRLQQKVDECLLDLFSKAQRFHPHLTIGRIKLLKNRQEFIKNLNQINVKKIEFDIKEFKLFESKLTKDGPKYYILKKFNE